MTRLQTEFHRLYSPTQTPDTVRALVLELHGPADWPLLSTVWRGVQTDLAWPAPAIAASGVDGLQLWFSVQEPLAVAQAQQVLAWLSQRYLPGVAGQRLKLLLGVQAPDARPSSHEHGQHGQPARPVPALDEASGNWSAFLAPDLAPIFSETPWLDVPPSEEGQANLLAGLGSIQAPELAGALAQLAPVATPPNPAAAPAPSASLGSPSLAQRFDDPRQFLLAVMNDGAVPLALRIEAAKALLPGA